MSSFPINRIFDLRNEIHQNVSHVYANKMQCQRLCERIDQLIDPLERLEHASSILLREETRPILDKLLQCIDDCNTYLEKFQSPDHWYEEIYEYKKSEEKFHELNQRLSQLGQDLSLGLNIQQIFDQKQDQEDRRNDFQDLTEKIDEISQKMLEKQAKQYQFIDQMLEKRFLSFRLYLTQHLFMQEDSTHQQFLHIPYKDLYIQDHLLGHGGFADVYKATWLTHHDQVAIKIIRLHHLANIQEDFYREISTMYRIRYENILSVLGACVEPNFYAIVVEYMPLGSLADILYKKNASQIIFDWADRYSIAWQMAKSINYLHNFNPSVLHRDIKSMNFLLKSNGSSKEKYLVKVCDFGLAEIRRETLSQSASFPSFEIVGSFYWKAPELFTAYARHTKASDVYSLGMVFWELATGRKPWDEYEDEKIIFIQVIRGERPTIPLDVPERYKKLIEDAWNHDPQKRPICFQLMERIYPVINSTNQSTTAMNEKDVIDLHPSQITTEPDYSVTSTTHTDSTRTAIEVAEEQKLTDSVPNIIISEPSQSDITTGMSSSGSQVSRRIRVNDVKKNNNIKQTETDQMESQSTIKHSTSCSSLNKIELPNQISLPFTPIFERTLSKSVEDVTLNTKVENDTYYSVNQTDRLMYRIEKRRPLHGKSVWTEKKN